MKLALDTNRYIDFARGDSEVVQAINRAERVFVPFIVLAELRVGWRLGSQPDVNERVLDEFLRRRGIASLFADDGTTRLYAELGVEQRRRNAMIPTNDLWIAALVIQYGLTLFSRDHHFEAIPRVPRI